MKNALLIYSGLIFTFLIDGSCLATESVKNERKELDGYSVVVPHGWKASAKQQKGDFIFTKRLGGQEQLVATISFVDQVLPVEKDLVSVLREGAVAEFTSRRQAIEMKSFSIVTVAGSPAYCSHHITGKPNDKTATLMYLVPDQKRTFYVTFACPSRAFEDNEESFRQIANSLVSADGIGTKRIAR